MRRVLDGGEGVVRGGRSDRSKESGVFGPEERGLDIRDAGCEVCSGGNVSDFEAMSSLAGVVAQIGL